MKSRSVALGTALAVLALAIQPVMAQAHPGSGEHGGGGGGGHSYSGHAGAGYSGGGGHSYSGHTGAGYSGGGHFAARSYSPSFRGGYAGSVAHASPSYASGRAPSTHFLGAAGGINHNVQGHFAPRSGWHYGNWRGGYWGGRFWPGVFWGASFAWFLPVLPFYTTYWYDGVPYYYYNNVYYTWDPAAAGYEVTNPPPAAASDSGADDSYAAPNTDVAPNYASPPAGPGAAPPSSDNLYAYPKNGQSDAQQGTDRRECEQWAGSQTGSGASAQPDGAAAAAGSLDFRRALTACLQGRGYSVD